MDTEVLRGNFSEAQALQIRREERERGNRVNIRRLHEQLLEIEVVYPEAQIIDVTPIHAIRQDKRKLPLL